MNSATNPRKFAEKIAKLHQKEQEQTQAFEQIMAEVIVATRPGGPADGANGGSQTRNHLHINQSVGASRAESLPNVTHMSRSGQNSIDLQSALSNLEEIKQGKSPGRERRRSPGGPAARGQSPRSAAHPEHRRPSPASPYSTPYLSPPDTWRRTNSDSALHQSSVLADRQNGAVGYTVLQQHVSRRSPVPGQMGSSSLTNISNTMDSGAQSASDAWDDRNRTLEYQVQMSGQPDLGTDPALRPKSCDVPGITIFAIQDDGHSGNSTHIPITGNTGSLPDLSSFHFPAPLSTPIDAEESVTAATAAQSSTPASNSQSSSLQYPNSGSPYGTSRQQPASPFSGNSNPNSPFSPQSPLSGMGYSPPGDSSHLTFDSMSHMKEASRLHRQALTYSQSYHTATAPTITVEGLALDTSALSLEANHHYHMNSVHGSRSSNGSCSADQQQNLTYPSNSQVQSVMCTDGMAVLSDQSNSGPPSPVSSFNHPASPAGVQVLRHTGDHDPQFAPTYHANVAQHQYHQFKMGNNFQNPENMQMLQGSTGHSSSSSASSSTGGLYMTTTAATHPLIPTDKVMELDFASDRNSAYECTPDDGAHYTSRNLPLSASSLMSSSSVPNMYSKSVISCPTSQYNSHVPQRPVLHSPQTSDSIPEIVLTEPLSDSEALLRVDFSKELGSAMGSFDAGDLFSADSFKSELAMDPIDFDGLQILTDIPESGERSDRS